MANKQQKPLEELTKEELIKKCLNQRNNIQQLQATLEKTQKEFSLHKAMHSDMSLPHKLQIAMNETLSYINEIEIFKKERINGRINNVEKNN